MAQADEQGQQELQSMIYKLELYKAQLKAVADNVGLVNASLEEYMLAKDTLKSYKGLKKGKELLVPVGANSFVYVTAKDVKNALVNIGADVTVRCTVDNALERLAKRIDELEGAKTKLMTSANALQQEMSKLSMDIEKAYRKG